MNRITLCIKDYPAFVKVFYPIMHEQYASKVIESVKVEALLKDKFGFDVVIHPGSPLWHINFSEKSYNHFMLAYG